MHAVDTNLLVRLITGDNTHQVAVAEAFVEPGAWVSTVALAETAWVLSSVYELDAHGVASAVRMLLEQKQLVLEHADAVAAALDRFETRPMKVSFTDCLLLELARKAGHVPLGTFDRELGRLPGSQRLR